MVGAAQHISPSSTPDAMAAMRQATAGQHARIESLLGLGGAFGRGHYGCVLQGFGAFLHAWERMVAPLLPPGLDGWFARGRRAYLVDRDLAALGLARLDPDSAVVPRLQGCADAIGSLYVLEGSALGGQLIAANIERRLGIHADNGGAYFNGCGKGTAARWRQYQGLAQFHLDAHPHAREAAGDAAVRTFEALIATFEPLLHERAAA